MDKSSNVVGALAGAVVVLFGGGQWLSDRLSIDVVFADPVTPAYVRQARFALAIVAFLGNSLPNLMVVIGVAYTPTFARLVHGAVLSVKQNEYVQAERVVGAGDWRIIRTSILPNVTAPIIVQASLSAGFAILVESGLSFLGLGVTAPTPSWGQMISTARGYMDSVPLLVLWPSLAVATTILAFNVLGDGLRDALDPRLIGN